MIMRKGYELIKWSTKENTLIFFQIHSSNSVKECINIDMKNLNVDIMA